MVNNMRTDVIIVGVLLATMVTGFWMTGKGIDEKIDGVMTQMNVLDSTLKGVNEKLVELQKRVDEHGKSPAAPAAPVAPVAPVAPAK